MRALKELLGVRETTCNDLVLIEAGVGYAKSVIKLKQIKFVAKIFGLEDYSESFIKRAISKAIQHRTPMGKWLQNFDLENDPRNPVEQCLQSVKSKICDSDSTHRTTAKLTLCCPKECIIPEVWTYTTFLTQS